MPGLTIKEIAMIAQVSRSTVSRVLNEHPSVRPSVRDQVLRVIRDHDYVPHAAARSLAGNRSHTIALLIPRCTSLVISDQFVLPLMQGIAEACAAQGYFLLLSILGEDGDGSRFQKILHSKRFDGLIMLSSDIDDPLLPGLIHNRVPLVLIGRHPYLRRISWVDVDNREGARRAVAHLIGLGHRRIATIAGPQHTVAGGDRRDGYKQALLEAGIPIRPELIIAGDFTQEAGYQAMACLIRLAEPPTAVFAAADALAIGALRALRASGHTAPDDMALVSFDDLPIARCADPPLTTVRQPIAAMGAAAVEALLVSMKHPESAAAHVCLPTELIIRDSCGARGPRACRKGGAHPEIALVD